MWCRRDGRNSGHMMLQEESEQVASRRFLTFHRSHRHPVIENYVYFFYVIIKKTNNLKQ